MRGKIYVGLLTIAVSFCLIFAAGAATPDPNDVADLFRALHGGKTIEPVRVLRTDTGFIESFGAPPGGYLENAAGKGLSGESAARAFLTSYAGAIANKSGGLGYGDARVQSADGRTYVRLSQTYASLPVFGAAITVQMDTENNVNFFLGRVMTDTRGLDADQTSTTPTLTAVLAKKKAVSFLEDKNPGESFTVTSTPILTVYDPSVVDNSGQPVLAWQMNVSSGAGGKRIAECVLVNAVTGEIALHYSIIYEAKNRLIYDAKDTTADPGFLTRSEGQGPVLLTDANNAYDYYGDTYDFYFNSFGRDSIDGTGLTMSATVRYCDDFECPLANAFWDGEKLRMYFGDGFAAADDVVAHELTHGVTQHESNLIYVNQSGAINESLSDIFGEFVDQSNGAGNDSPPVKWLMGEDVPGFGALRSMSNPPLFGDPDRLGSPLYFTGDFDNGGVHFNSGIGNKLCFLLTDGQSFNGVTVTGMGIPKVAQLFYEAQIHLLVPSSNYHDLYAALTQAALNVGLNFSERQNVESATCAVEIAPDARPLGNFRAQSKGDGSVLLSWANRSCSAATVMLIRKSGSFPTSSSDGAVIFGGIGDTFTDTGLTSGVEYFYGLFDSTTTYSMTGAQFARAVSGSPVPNSYTEEFNNGSLDLNFTQIVFTPSYDVNDANLSGRPGDYVNYGDYAASVTKNVTTLPVSRDGSWRLFLADDSYVTYPLSTPIPFFGSSKNNLYIYANGFMSFQKVTSIYGAESGAETLAKHFEVPRISFLFSELSPRTGGESWLRVLNDRVVVTFDKIPEFGFTETNTVQTELFYSGQIRITYLELHAQTAVCGLSDGRGIPPDPLTFKNSLSDLSELGTSTRLLLDPIPVISETAGNVVTFQAVATGGSPPAAPVTYSAVGLPSGASIDASTGAFNWPTQLNQAGQYSLIVKAAKGIDVASQEVTIYLADAAVAPEVIDLSISPAKPGVGDALTGQYTYTHPSNMPESGSTITWYRNGSSVPTLAGQLSVPGPLVEGGDTWYFSVIPRALNGMEGPEVFSPSVKVRNLVESDVNGDGFVDAVDVQVVVNAALGLDVTPYDADVNGDGSIDSTDIQLVINAAVL